MANKIGTYAKAVLAHRHGIPFYVAIPLSTIDWNLKSGRNIPIEERDAGEVLGAWGVISNLKSQISNPQFYNSSLLCALDGGVHDALAGAGDSGAERTG